MISLAEPMQVRNQRLLSSEKTTSSPTWQSGTATVFTANGRLRHVDDAQLGLAERGDIGLRRIAIVEDVVGDEIGRQRNGLDDLAEVRRGGIDVDDGDAFLPRLARHRAT